MSKKGIFLSLLDEIIFFIFLLLFHVQYAIMIEKNFSLIMASSRWPLFFGQTGPMAHNILVPSHRCNMCLYVLYSTPCALPGRCMYKKGP